MEFERKLGISPVAFISSKYSNGLKRYEIIDDIPCHRSQFPKSNFGNRIPVLKERLIMKSLQKDILRTAHYEPFAIIHAHSPILCGMPALNAARRLKIPIIYEVRALWEDAAVEQNKTKKGSPRYLLTRHLETNLLKKVDAVVTICQGLKEEIVRREVSDKKIYVIPNGVDTAKFTPLDKDPELIKRYNLKDRVVLGFIGSFFAFEGLQYLIKAMPKILAGEKKVTLLVVGAGEQEDILRNLVSNLQLGNSIIFAGQVSHDKILKFYSVMDILVYPRIGSRLTHLVTPLKSLEAMSMQKAVIGSDVGGIKELIKDGKTGLLFKAGNIDDLADKSLDLIHSKEKREELGRQARIDMIENRNWFKIIPDCLKIYEKLIKRNFN